MAFNVAEFRAAMIGDGARPNLFSVSLTFPTFSTGGADAGRKVTFMAKASQLPGSTIGTVPLNYFGREIKLAGNRTFPDWTITVINDEDFVIRNAMEQWHSTINGPIGNQRQNTVQSVDNGYGVNATVIQYSKEGNPIKQYSFVGRRLRVHGSHFE